MYAEELTAAGPICDVCLGQRVAKIGHGLAAEVRGRLARAVCLASACAPERCWVCGGLFVHLSSYADRAAELAEDLEFATFLFGVRMPARLEATQEILDARFPSRWAEPVHREVTRSLGRAFERALARTGRTADVDFRRPDLRFTVDLDAGAVEPYVASLLLTGRYRKLVRGIPQTRWPCRSCGGAGCGQCGGTGRQYPVSVEELVVPPLVEAFGGEGGRLHGAGREDVDARMLGRGRPFVAEVDTPHRRSGDLDALSRAVNAQAGGKVEVHELRYASADSVERIKAARADKRYRARVAFSRAVADEELTDALRCVTGVVEQRTPLRVRHRRADLIRRRYVRQATGNMVTSLEAELVITGQAGLYIKELISGDGGGTRPSLAEALGIKARVVELDVLDVLDETPSGPASESRQLG